MIIKVVIARSVDMTAEDGSVLSSTMPSVGTNDRKIWNGKTIAGARRAAARYANGRARYSIEYYFPDTFHGRPFRVDRFGQGWTIAQVEESGLERMRD